MTMSPLYPCGQICSTGTRNETVKRLILFSALMKGIAVTIVTHKSCNGDGTLFQCTAARS